ncbi:hypothetical protein GGI10_003968, partial [Coemansia sp. RSA 2530]
MSHINNLPLSVLAQILFKAALPPAGSLHEWKEKLPLLAVCQAWAKLAVSFVLNKVFVEVTEACSSYNTHVEEPTHSSHVAWTSNAELIISHNCMRKAKRLEIEMPDGATIDHLRHIVLEILKLDRVDWLGINTLSFTYSPLICGHFIEPGIDRQSIADAARTMQFFGQNMRGIVELNLTGPTYENADALTYANLASIYGGQLQVLRSAVPVVLGPFHFRSIAVLELSLDAAVAPVIPSVSGETLKVLKLNNVPHNFAWHCFRYDIYTRPIVFRQLTILHLSYDYDDNPAAAAGIQSKVASGALNCDQLVFPALKKLTIENCTPDCDLLYAEEPFPELKSVHLSGWFDEISYCSRLKLAWVGDLHVEASLSDTNEAAKVYSTTSHFFSSICIGRTATLEIGIGRFTIDPELIRWINLTKLKVLSINYKSLCRVIARLPNITDFEAYRLEFGAATLESLAV